MSAARSRDLGGRLAERTVELVSIDLADWRFRSEVGVEPGSVRYEDGLLRFVAYLPCEYFEPSPEEVREVADEEDIGKLYRGLYCLERVVVFGENEGELRRNIENEKRLDAEKLCDAIMTVLEVDPVDVGGREYWLNIEEVRPSVAGDRVRCEVSARVSHSPRW